MAKDKNGVDIAPDDIVVLKCRVLGTTESEGVAAVMLEPVENVGGGGFTRAFNVNSKQVEAASAPKAAKPAKENV